MFGPHCSGRIQFKLFSTAVAFEDSIKLQSRPMPLPRIGHLPCQTSPHGKQYAIETSTNRVLTNLIYGPLRFRIQTRRLGHGPLIFKAQAQRLNPSLETRIHNLQVPLYRYFTISVFLSSTHGMIKSKSSSPTAQEEVLRVNTEQKL